MQDFAFLRHVAIGQYLPGESLIHRLDARVKLTLVMALTIALVANTSYIANGVLFVICLGLIGAAGLPLRYVVGVLRPALPVLAFLALFQLLFLGDASVVTTAPRLVFWQWGPFNVTSSGVQLVVISLLRLIDLTVLATLLTNTTPMAYLAHGIEDMLKPFSRLGLPAHEISLVGVITLRFVPLLAEQLETIMKAQASRGANLGAGGRLCFVQNTRAVLVLIVPLFLDAFRRAEDLIVAMEARCYAGGKGRTRLTDLRMTPADAVILAAGLLCSAGLVALARRFPF